LSVEDARTLLDSISLDSLQVLRDRALIGVMLFSFARVSAVLAMKVSDFYENRRRRWFRFTRLPVHHKAQDYVADYLEKADFKPDKPLFQTFHKKEPTGRPMSRSEAYRMIRRRALAAGISAPVCAAIRSGRPGSPFTWKTTERSKRLRRSRRMSRHARPSYTIEPTIS
jgi:integrase